MYISKFFFIFFISSICCALDIPNEDDCTVKYIEIREQYNTLDDIISEWDKNSVLCPKDGSFDEYKAATYVAYGQAEKAVTYLLSEANKYKVVPKKILFGLAEIYDILGLQDKSKENADLLIINYPDWYGGYRVYGNYYYNEKKYDSALKFYTKALNKQDGYNGGNLMSIVATNYHLHNYKSAIYVYALCEKFFPKYAYYSKGATTFGALSLIHLGRVDEAACILSKQSLNDSNALSAPVFKNALKLYEETTGKPLDLAAYYEAHCKDD